MMLSFLTFSSDRYAIMLDVLLNDVTINQTHKMHAYRDSSAACKALVYGAHFVTMTYIYFCLGIFLVPFMGLGGAQGPCPTVCHCTLEILNCSRITNLPGFHQVPLPNPAVPLHPFTHLDFTGNVISSIGKEVWKAYPWAEHLVLKENSLSRLQSTSLEGLFSLTYLDLSCNKIQIIEKNVFEAVPFLRVINLSGNNIQQVTYGTFRAWHGMQFLLKVDLSNNPLVTIQDSYFYGLPSLAYLDLGATDVTPRILENLLRTALRLKTLVLPQKMSCCLCLIKEDIEVLCDTVKLECTESCGVSATLCDKEEPLIRMQQEVLKVLQIRKMNSSSLLSILPKRAQPNHGLPQTTKPNNDLPAVAENDSSLTANFNLLESVKRLMQAKAGEPLDMYWVDKGELKKLYLLVSLLREALKERIVQLDQDSLAAPLHNELSAQVSKKSTDDFLRKERHVRKVRRKKWLGTNQRQKDTLVGLQTDRQGVAEIARGSAKEPTVFEMHSKAGSQRKLAEGLDPQRVLPFRRSRQAVHQSSRKRSISDSLTNALKPTGSIVVNNNDNSENPRAMLGNGFGAQTFSEEELLNQLLQRNSLPAEDGKSKNSAIDSKRSLNEVSPDITLSHGTYWEHQKASVSPPLNFLSLEDDYFSQRVFFEAELDKKLTTLIPNAPVRKLISHVIRVLQMDCMTPTVQVACAKLISNTGLLMKLFSEREKAKETSSLWKSYFWPSKNVSNKTIGRSGNLEKPLDMTRIQGMPEYEPRKKLVLAVSVTAILMIIVFIISLYEICIHRYAAKDWTFLGRRKKPSSDEELCRTGSSLEDKSPPPLSDTQSFQEMQNQLADTGHYGDPSEEEEILEWGAVRQPLPKAPVENIKSAPSVVSELELTTAPPAAPPPPNLPSFTGSQKSSLKKSSVIGGGTSKVTINATPSATTEGEEDDEEDSAEKSEASPTEATTESPESGEEEDEDESE
uniref:Uncharacterized protein n=1 Tax=Sphaerodactylus townsendi TaxID=933632 RepID=A0ACB8E8F8_9SAUR